MRHPGSGNRCQVVVFSLLLPHFRTCRVCGSKPSAGRACSQDTVKEVLRPLLGWPGKNRAARPEFDDPSVLKENESVSNLSGEAELMRDHDHREPLRR